MMTPQSILEKLPENGLFREKGIPWRISPEPFSLSPAILRQLKSLGPILARFQDASHELYLLSAAGKQHPWLAGLLDQGKPLWLQEAQKRTALRQAAPRVIRPDLLYCAAGLRMTELDSVPGGLGITHFLNQSYSSAGFTKIIAGANGITEGLMHSYPKGIKIAISDESRDYRPEMEYLAAQLPSASSCASAEELLLCNELEKASEDAPTLYRFFELFDYKQIPAARELLEARARGDISLDPSPLAHLEEKAWLALFHLPSLQTWWKQKMRASHLKLLQEIIPQGLIVDPCPLPHQASLPWLNCHHWDDVAQFSKKERQMALKISGYDQRAWGARGVAIGHDMSSSAWKEALQQALSEFNQHVWILQNFQETQLIEQSYYEKGSEKILSMQGRVRLCPYYFRSPDGRDTRLGGCLATIVPADKKKIHGMKDAILAPCQLG